MPRTPPFYPQTKKPEKRRGNSMEGVERVGGEKDILRSATLCASPGSKEI